MGGKRWIALGAVAAAALGAPDAGAQEPVEIRVVAAGMTLAGVEVFVLVQGEPAFLGETADDGRILAPLDLVGLRLGDPVEVHQVSCSAGRSLLLVPAEETADEECERRRQRDPTCTCGSLGTLAWDRDVEVDVVAEPRADVARARRDDDDREPRREEGDREPRGAPGRRTTWTVAAGGGWSSWPNLEDGCQGAVRPAVCRIEGSAPTLRVALEARRDFPLSLLAALGYTSGLAVEQRFAEDPNPRLPRANEAELDVLTVEAYAVARRPVSAFEAFVALGYVWAYERVEASTTFGAPGLTASDSRADSGGKLGGRAGLDWWSRGGALGARIEVGGMMSGAEDLDTSWTAAGMVLVPVGGR